MIENVLVGADPEIFFITKDGTPQSVEGLIGGSKTKPKPMEGLGDGFFIQEDNVAAEFNIPPARNCTEFIKNIFQGVQYVQKVAKANKLKLAFVPDLDFPKEQLTTKHAQILGCDPDFNSWTEVQNQSPKPPELMRTAAGHIHIGWDNPEFNDVIWVARLFDLFVTVPSILVTEPNRRRQLYGRAGACRLKQYGVECRSADNFWVNSKKHMARLYSNIMSYIDLINSGLLPYEAVLDAAGKIYIAINNHDRDIARELCNKFEVPTFETVNAS